MSDIKIGTKVRHPSRGDGVVSTVVYSPLTKRPVKAVVEFGFSPGVTRKLTVWAGDLAVIENSVERPSLRLIEFEPGVA